MLQGATGDVMVPPNLTQQEGRSFAPRLGCHAWCPSLPYSGPSARGLPPTVGSTLDPYGSPVMQRRICWPASVGSSSMYRPPLLP